MAKQYRKLQHKLYKDGHPEKNKPKEPPIGKDYVLLAVTVFTVVITVIGWQQLDGLSRGMYTLLSISLIFTYAKRHANVTDRTRMYMERTSFGTMILAVVLFLVVTIPQLIGWIRS